MNPPPHPAAPEASSLALAKPALVVLLVLAVVEVLIGGVLPLVLGVHQPWERVGLSLIGPAGVLLVLGFAHRRAAGFGLGNRALRVAAVVACVLMAAITVGVGVIAKEDLDRFVEDRGNRPRWEQLRARLGRDAGPGADAMAASAQAIVSAGPAAGRLEALRDAAGSMTGEHRALANAVLGAATAVWEHLAAADEARGRVERAGGISLSAEATAEQVAQRVALAKASLEEATALHKLVDRLPQSLAEGHAADVVKRRTIADAVRQSARYAELRELCERRRIAARGMADMLGLLNDRRGAWHLDAGTGQPVFDDGNDDKAWREGAGRLGEVQQEAEELAQRWAGAP